MKITALKQQIKDQNRASVFIDGKYSFSLTVDQLLDEKLKVGKLIEPAYLIVLKKKSADGKLRMRVIEWLSIRPRSIKELQDYLRKKNVEKDYSSQLITEMQNKKYLSDEVFSRWYAEHKIRQLKSLREISFLLKQKGVDQDIINEILDEHTATEKEKLLRLIAKKRSSIKYRDNEKLLVYLVRKGYSFSDVKEALAEG